MLFKSHISATLGKCNFVSRIADRIKDSTLPALLHLPRRRTTTRRARRRVKRRKRKKLLPRTVRKLMLRNTTKLMDHQKQLLKPRKHRPEQISWYLDRLILRTSSGCYRGDLIFSHDRKKDIAQADMLKWWKRLTLKFMAQYLHRNYPDWCSYIP